MKILSKLKNALDSRARVAAADMKRLSDVREGLADEATRYIVSGENETVLSTIATLCAGNELDVAELYVFGDTPTWPRRQLLAQHRPYDLEFSRRYTEVLAANCKALPDEAAGSAKANRLVRIFFSEVFDGVKKGTNVWPPEPSSMSRDGLTLDTAAKMVEALGGTLVDLVDVLYSEKGQYSSISGDLYRKVVDVQPLAQGHPSAFKEAASRINAASRSTLLRDLHRFGLAESADYGDFILGLAGDGAKAVRETANSILSEFDVEGLEPKATALLATGTVAMRSGMVELLAKMGTDSALNALQEHRSVEKTARIISAIDTAMTATEHTAGESTGPDDATQYTALDGSLVEIPPAVPLADGVAPTFGAEDRQTLVHAIREENAHIKEQNEQRKRHGIKYHEPPLKENLADHAVAFIETGQLPKGALRNTVWSFLTWGPGEPWARTALAKFPPAKALRLATSASVRIDFGFLQYDQGPFRTVIQDFLNAPDGDLRHVEWMELENAPKVSFGYARNALERPMEPGDFLRYTLQDDYWYLEPELDSIPNHALWPYLAQNLDVIDEAFGLKPLRGVTLSRVAAIRTLTRLPKPPARYFGKLLEVATGETKSGRQEARDMLSGAPDVGRHVIAMLEDSRQAIRAGAAQWLAQRGDAAAVEPLKARLKKDKSHVAKAAILTALEGFGEDLTGFVGPGALLKEAQVGLKKAKLDKLAWLSLDHLPKVRYRSNQVVPPEVLRWWLYLAVKLKQPGGNALFDIYLAQLNPDDAMAFSNWLLDSWYNYDSARPTDEEGNAYAAQNVDGRYNALLRWYKDYTKERAFDDLKREFMAEYLNSGAATKGLLALCKHTPPALAADRVRGYLKSHGSRTSQSSALLELLAAMGDPVTLQVVISAATRLKQKAVQKFAGTLIETVAEQKSWSLDELGDRTVPTAGLDEDGLLVLPCGVDERAYVAAIGDSLTLELRNPDGKFVKSLPGGQDEATKASKKQLSASRRELKQATQMQTSRLYEALCIGRQWPIDDWKRDIAGHPIMRKLAERAIWRGLDAQGDTAGLFRPTPEGDYTDANDEDRDIEVFSSVGLAHSALIIETDALAWATHLNDYEVTPIFDQVGNVYLSVDDEQKSNTLIVDRKGWVTDTFTIRGAAAKLGYERGDALDGGFFNEYVKGFRSAEVIAVIEFSGNCLPEENVPAAMISLRFEKYPRGRRTGGNLALSEVPPVLLSECWNDYRTMVAKANFDADWEKKMPW
ncbi:MAG: DUF4132 domain-containing protein [Pseudomonadota bacterium]